MTRFNFRQFFAGAAFCLILPMVLRADQPDAGSEKLLYVKPAGVTEKTRGRIAPGRAGPVDPRVPEDLNVVILCPDHTGLTVQEHPSIFWFMNKPVKDIEFKVSVTSEGDPEPLLEKVWKPGEDFGIQRLDLKDIPKPLEPNTDYKVAVTLLVNPKDHSKDLGTSGLIRRIAAPEKLVSKLLSRPTPAERAVVYARQGIWYDALASISDQITADPKNKKLHEQRAELLKQGDLREVADFEQLQTGK